MSNRLRAARGRIRLPILVPGGILLGAALLRSSGGWPAADAERVALLPTTVLQAFPQIARAYREADELFNAS